MDTGLRRDRQIQDSVQKAIDAQMASFKAIRNLMVICVLLVFLGFPGTLNKVIGSGVAKILEYITFGMQFLLVMLATGNDVMSIKLVNLQPAYWVPYLYVAYVSVSSMAVSIERKTVVMTVLHLILTTMFALWLVEQYDIEEMLTLFYIAQFIFMAVTLVSTVLFSKITFYRYQGSNTFRGLFATKNECGTQLAFGITVQLILLNIYLQKKSRISITFLITLGVQFVFMLLTKNMGALLITMMCIGYVVYYSMKSKKAKKKKPKRIPLGMMFIIISIGFLFFALTVLQALEPFLNSLGKDASLTGRVPLWNQTMVVMQESHTLFGYGLEMFWKTPSAVKAFHSGFHEDSWAATASASTHNMIMEMWCNEGLVGVALFFFMFLMAERGVKYMKENQYLFSSSFLVMFTIRSLTERQTDPSSIYSLGCFIIVAMMDQAFYRHRMDKQKKARIFVDEDKDTAVQQKDTSSDMAAFQMRFSNISEARPIPPPPRGAARRFVHTEDEQETENKLESLLKEFDDDE